MPLKTRLEHSRIAIIGLGYVGLPLAVDFGKQYDTVGFDINAARIAELRQGRDSTLEVEPELLAQSARLRYADTLAEIAACGDEHRAHKSEYHTDAFAFAGQPGWFELRAATEDAARAAEAPSISTWPA